MKDDLIKSGKLLDDDVKILRQKILFKKPYGEVINFAVNQLGLSRKEAISLWDELSVECHQSWKNVRADGGGNG